MRGSIPPQGFEKFLTNSKFGQDSGRIGFWGVLERDLKFPSIWSIDFGFSWWDKVTHMSGSSNFDFVT